MASGWNLWVWLECIGVVSGCCCKEVYRFPRITYPYSTCISTFLQQLCSSFAVLLCSFFKCFSVLYIYNINILGLTGPTTALGR